MTDINVHRVEDIKLKSKYHMRDKDGHAFYVLDIIVSDNTILGGCTISLYGDYDLLPKLKKAIKNVKVEEVK